MRLPDDMMIDGGLGYAQMEWEVDDRYMPVKGQAGLYYRDDWHQAKVINAFTNDAKTVNSAVGQRFNISGTDDPILSYPADAFFPEG